MTITIIEVDALEKVPVVVGKPWSNFEDGELFRDTRYPREVFLRVLCGTASQAGAILLRDVEGDQSFEYWSRKDFKDTALGALFVPVTDFNVDIQIRSNP